MDEPTKLQTLAQSPRATAPKKPYAPPQLIVHGTVAELTQNGSSDQPGYVNIGG